MRDELLFIDGELVDLDDNTKITLKYSSNIFTDLNKIVSNSSYTIKLPDTVRNQRLIEHADLPACNTDYQRRVHAARYFRNGIEIISKAQAVLMSVGETFDMAMVWGNKTSFASVINDGKKLTDLSSGTIEGEDYVVWKNWGAFSERFPNINYGFNNGEANAWHHPVVKAKWILGKIQKENKVNFQFPENKLPLIDKMIVPLISRNDALALYDKYPISFLGDGATNEKINGVTMYGENYGLNIKFNGNATQLRYGEAREFTYESRGGYALTTKGYALNHDSNETKLQGSIITSFIMSYNPPDANSLCIEIRVDGALRASIKPTTFQSVGNLQFTAGFNIKSTISIKQGETLFFVLHIGASTKSVNQNISMSISIGNRGEVYLGEKYPFAPNLPDIKQIDFIKAISQMMGVFAIPVGDDTIQFVSVDDIIANKSKAVNWTRKVIASSHENKPRSMNYILDGFARNNRFKWKEDNTVKGNYDGNIVVNDSTIEYERDAVTLPFAASDTKGEVAYIPIYSYKEDGSLDYSSKNVKPRLLYLDGVKGVFTGLSWDKLIAENYSNYIKIVSNPRIITEKIEINDIELKNLDVTVPAYLGQYGRYYAIISVKAEDTGICECKLLQLEV